MVLFNLLIHNVLEMLLRQALCKKKGLAAGLFAIR